MSHRVRRRITDQFIRQMNGLIGNHQPHINPYDIGPHRMRMNQIMKQFKAEATKSVIERPPIVDFTNECIVALSAPSVYEMYQQKGMTKMSLEQYTDLVYHEIEMGEQINIELREHQYLVTSFSPHNRKEIERILRKYFINVGKCIREFEPYQG